MQRLIDLPALVEPFEPLPTNTPDPDIRNSLEQHLRHRLDPIIEAAVLQCAEVLNRLR